MERQKAEDSLRKINPKIIKPVGFSQDKVANKYWNKIIKDCEELELLCELDADILAEYCKILSRLRKLEKIVEKVEDIDTYNKIMGGIRADQRNLLAYATKLGLTPESRARLAYKKSQQEEIDPEEDLYGSTKIIFNASGY